MSEGLMVGQERQGVSNFERGEQLNNLVKDASFIIDPLSSKMNPERIADTTARIQSEIQIIPNVLAAGTLDQQYQALTVINAIADLKDPLTNLLTQNSLAIIESNIQQISQLTTVLGINRNSIAARVLSCYVNNGEKKLVKEQCLQRLQAYSTTNLEATRTSNINTTALLTEFPLVYGKPEQSEEAMQIILTKILPDSGILDEKNSMFNEHAVRHLLMSSESKAVKMTKSILSTYLFQHDFSDHNMLETWDMANEEFAHTATINLTVINYFLQKHPHFLQNFSQESHVSNFARYPHELIEEYGKQGASGRAVYARFDPKGGFYEDYSLLKNFHSRLMQRAHIKLAEVGSPLEMKALLEKQTQQFGKGKFGIIGGHGSPAGIQLGGTHWKQMLNEIDLLEDVVLQEYFEEDAPIVLFSCETGKTEEDASLALAQKFSRISGLTFIAPEASTAPTALRPVFTGDKITDLAVEYGYGKVRARKFVKGELVE